MSYQLRSNNLKKLLRYEHLCRLTTSLIENNFAFSSNGYHAILGYEFETASCGIDLLGHIISIGILINHYYQTIKRNKKNFDNSIEYIIEQLYIRGNEENANMSSNDK